MALWRRWRQAASQTIIRQDDQLVETADLLEGQIFEDLADLSEYAFLCSNIYLDKKYTENYKNEKERFNLPGWKKEDINYQDSVPKLAIIKPKGFQYEVWTKEKTAGNYCSSIVFRGTDFPQLGDWISNGHWFTRPIKWFVWDQYDQTRALLPDLISYLHGTYGKENVEIIATGHSLGGGLAQQAAYATQEINKVYAFDPSPVTGFSDIPKFHRNRNKEGVVIYRVYEHGEILAYLRLAMKVTYRFNPNPNSNPKVIEVRVNLSSGSSVSQHGMKALACELYERTPHNRTILTGKTNITGYFDRPLKWE